MKFFAKDEEQDQALARAAPRRLGKPQIRSFRLPELRGDVGLLDVLDRRRWRTRS